MPTEGNSNPVKAYEPVTARNSTGRGDNQVDEVTPTCASGPATKPARRFESCSPHHFQQTFFINN